MVLALLGAIIDHRVPHIQLNAQIAKQPHPVKARHESVQRHDAIGPDGHSRRGREAPQHCILLLVEHASQPHRLLALSLHIEDVATARAGEDVQKEGLEAVVDWEEPVRSLLVELKMGRVCALERTLQDALHKLHEVDAVTGSR